MDADIVPTQRRVLQLSLKNHGPDIERPVLQCASPHLQTQMKQAREKSQTNRLTLRDEHSVSESSGNDCEAPRLVLEQRNKGIGSAHDQEE